MTEQTGDPEQSITPLQERVQKCWEVWQVQGMPGTWNSDAYMRGMFNGMELMMSILEDREPQYRSVPKEGYTSYEDVAIIPDSHEGVEVASSVHAPQQNYGRPPETLNIYRDDVDRDV